MLLLLVVQVRPRFQVVNAVSDTCRDVIICSVVEYLPGFLQLSETNTCLSRYRR